MSVLYQHNSHVFVLLPKSSSFSQGKLLLLPNHFVHIGHILSDYHPYLHHRDCGNSQPGSPQFPYT